MPTIASGTTQYLISGTGGTYTNAGSRSVTATGTIAKPAVLIEGNNDTIVNTSTGLISSNSYEGMEVFTSPGFVTFITNQSGGIIRGTNTASKPTDGINIQDGTKTTPIQATIFNAGLIYGDGYAGVNGIDFNNHAIGTVINLSTGTISGGGIYGYAQPGDSVVNSGVILGDSVYGAIYFKDGATVTNLAGTIAAGAGNKYGIKIIGAAGTVTNAGTITGGSPTGNAVILTSGFTNRVIVDPTGVFIGTVSGGGATTATLEVDSGSSQGTLTGLGTQFTNFGTVDFGAAANFIVEGSSAAWTSESIVGFNRTDTIDVTGFTATNPGTLAGGTSLVLTNGGGNQTLHFTGSVSQFIVSTGAFGTDITTICFCPGTKIRTPNGETNVEHLSVGDTVVTLGHNTQKITWIGKGKVLATRGKRGPATPVIVRKSALADNVPNADLHVTKGHSFYFDGVLIPAEFLVNHKTILWDDRAQEVEIYHVELATHDVLFANGAPAESYRDDGNRWLFQNANEGWDQPDKPHFAPVLTGGKVVDAVWQSLLDRAGGRSRMPTTEDSDLHLLVDGLRVDALVRQERILTFRLPAAPSSVRVVSRDGVPAELGLVRDPRSLGVALRKVMLIQGRHLNLIEAQDERLTDGFHDYEAADNLRWTKGDAALPIEAFAGFGAGTLVEVHLGGATVYARVWEAGEAAA